MFYDYFLNIVEKNIRKGACFSTVLDILEKYKDH